MIVSAFKQLRPFLLFATLLSSTVGLAQTQIIFNNNNGTLDFSGTPVSVSGSGTGKTQGDVMLYESVGTIDGVDIDVTITTFLVPSGSAVDVYDGTSAVPGGTTLWQPNIDLSGGEVHFKIAFFRDYNPSTAVGTPITLQNVLMNSYDIDYNQYQIFDGFTQYMILSSGSNIVPTALSGGLVKFQGPSANGSNSDADRIQVSFSSVHECTVAFGSTTNGSTNYFGIEFGPGPSWSTTTIGTPAAVLEYSSLVFAESSANDGSIGNDISITLSNETFTGTNGSTISGVTFSNVPSGLSASVTKVDDTHATLSLGGNALDHENVDDISNLTVEFGNTSFTGNSAIDVTGYLNSSLICDFEDNLPPSVYLDGSSLGPQTTSLTFNSSGYDQGDVLTITVDGTAYLYTVGSGGETAEQVYDHLKSVIVSGTVLSASLSSKGVVWPDDLDGSNTATLAGSNGSDNAFSISASIDNSGAVSQPYIYELDFSGISRWDRQNESLDIVITASETKSISVTSDQGNSEDNFDYYAPIIASDISTISGVTAVYDASTNVFTITSNTALPNLSATSTASSPLDNVSPSLVQTGSTPSNQPNPTVNTTSTASGSYDNSATFTEVMGTDDGSAAVSFTIGTTNLFEDGTTLSNLKVSIDNTTLELGDQLILGTTLIDLNSSSNSGEVLYNGTYFEYSTTDVSTSRTITFTSLSGTGGSANPAVLASYESLIDALKFNNTSDDPDAGGSNTSRVFDVITNDGTLSSNTGTFTVTIVPVVDVTCTAPSITTQPNNPTAFCAGTGTENISVVATGSSLIYQWYIDGSTAINDVAPYSGTSTSSLTISNPSSSLDNKSYTVVVSNSCGSVTSSTATITVNALPTVTVDAASDALCYGADNGAITITATGTATLSYAWTDGAFYSSTNEDISDLAPGTYTVTVTDGNGCTSTGSATISEPSAALSATASGTNTTSTSGTDGTATVSVIGGTTAYTYAWSDGQTTATATGLAAGTYTVTVTDANNCTTAASVTIYDKLVASASVTTSNDCNGDTDAEIAVTVTGGKAPFTYAWDDASSATTSSVTGLAAGTYEVNVTDAENTTATATVTVTDPTAISASASATDVLCNGDATGGVDLTVSGGTPFGSGTPYNYAWTGPNSFTATTEDLTNVEAGSYSVVITDANGCTNTVNVTVNEPTALAGSTTATDATGYGLSNGSATASGSGGTPGYTYTWSDGQTGASASNLAAGTYTVVIKDANNCSITKTVVIDEPDDLVANGSETNAVSCNGVADGAVSVSVTGGVSPYTYVWDDANSSTTSSVTGLEAGDYDVTVTDANGNTTTETVTVTEPSAIIGTATVTDALCNGGTNGVIEMTVSGGTPSLSSPLYTYSWTGPNGFTSTSEDLSGLEAGSYVLVITDANGCNETVNVTVGEPVAISATSTSTDATGFGLSNGTASVTPSGGTPTYTYSWNTTPAQTGATATGLAAGSYIVTITDANGCTYQETVIVDEPDQLIATIPNSTNIDCFGNATGTANVSVTGGVAPYTYSWNDAASQNVANATGLAAGSYTVTVVDANNNQTTGSVTLTQPTLLTTSIASTTDVTCSGNSDGAVTTSANGGTTPYTYSWDNGATTQNLSSVAEGTYELTVTDANGCTATASTTVGMTDNVDPVVVTQDVTVYVDASGNVSITTSDIDNGSSDACGIDTYTLDKEDFTCADLGANTVTLTVTDVNGNSATGTATVTVVDNIDPTVTAPADVTVDSDAGSCDAAATGVTLGTPTTADNCSVASVTNDAPTTFPLGTTTVTWTVTDGSGNTTTVTQVVTVEDNEDPTITAPVDITVDADAGSCNALATGVTLGTPTTADNCSVASVTSDAPATFPLGTTTVTWTVTDGSGNTSTATQVVTVEDNEDPTITAPADVTVDADAGSCNALATGVTLGTPTTADNCSVVSVTNDAPTTFPLGTTTVTWTVTDGSGNTSTATQTVTVEDNEDPVISCPSNVTAYADATSNGTAVTWTAATATDNCSIQSITSDIANGSTFTLGTTTVTYTATDGSGNTATCTFDVTVLDTVSPVISGCPADITQTNDLDSCGAAVSWTAPTFYDNSGSYTVVYSHNSGDYFPVGTTTVTVTVTDAAGNSSVCTFDVTVEDNQAPYVFPETNVSITLNGDGMYTMTAGQLDSASYDNCGIDSMYLSNDFANCNAMPSMTTYLVVVDTHGNMDSALVTVNVLPSTTAVLATTATVTDVSCYGTATGEIDLATTGGVAPYEYDWSTGDITSAITNLGIGMYTYTVSDTNGCTMVDSVFIDQPDTIVASSVLSVYGGGYNVSQFGAADGSITMSIAGGTLPYAYDWNAGVYNTMDLNGVTAGAYTLVITDSLGCTYTHHDTLTEPEQLIVSAKALTLVICPEDTSGEAIATISGGVQPYSILWDLGDTTDYVGNLQMAIYEVTITDANGAVATDTVLVDALDYDCDGIYNVDEGGTPNGGNGDIDTDGDGIPNQEDEDSDNDGLPDSEEFDTNQDGVNFDDCDEDGIPDFLDPDFCGLLIPDVFTPNGDGDNDTWEILGIHAHPDNTVTIYNRWGELVYYKEAYDNEFNGRANSRTYLNKGDGLLPTGTYYYMVKLYATGDVYTGYVYITK